MIRRATIAIICGLGLTLSLLALTGGLVAADGNTHHVVPGGNCGGATPCYGTIQAALDAAAEGDLIKVAEGTYSDIHTLPDLTPDFSRNRVNLNGTLWHANTGGDWSGAGMISHHSDHYGSPAFENDDHHLTALSAAIDRGVAADVFTDIDGDPRPRGLSFDLGADEFQGTTGLGELIFLPAIRK